METKINKGWLVVIAVVIILGGFIWWGRQSKVSEPANNEVAQVSSTPSPTALSFTCHLQQLPQRTVTLGKTAFQVAYAATREDRAQGLAGCEELADQTGMYFHFDTPVSTAFWMRGMLIPLDIIWIADNKVVKIDANVPVPAAGEVTTDLPQYQSPGLIQGVLEIAAGGAQAHGLEVGQTITISPLDK